MSPKKLSHVKQLQRDANEIWKQCVGLRDGPGCKVKQLYPEIAITHTNVYQADHCFTRANKHLFLEVANGTMICSACNMAKHYDNKSVKRAVDDIVRQREGEEKWNEMLEIDMKMGPNYNWGKIWWLEEQKERLENERSEWENVSGARRSIVNRQGERTESAKVEQRKEEVSLGELFDKNKLLPG